MRFTIVLASRVGRLVYLHLPPSGPDPEAAGDAIMLLGRLGLFPLGIQRWASWK